MKYHTRVWLDYTELFCIRQRLLIGNIWAEILTSLLLILHKMRADRHRKFENISINGNIYNIQEPNDRVGLVSCEN